MAAQAANFNMPPPGGIISLWAARPQFHRPLQAADKDKSLSAAGAAGEIACCARSEIGGYAAIEIIACGNIEIALATLGQCLGGKVGKQQPPSGGIISLWAERPQFHRPLQAADKK